MLVYKTLGPYAIRYIRECLQSGGSLSRMLLSHEFAAGTVAARVPPDADESGLSDFTSGSMFHEPEYERESVSDLAAAIAGYLAGSQRRVCVLDCYPMSPQDPHLKGRDFRWNYFGDDLYLLLNGVLTIGEIEKSIYFAQNFMFTGCLSSLADDAELPTAFGEIPIQLMTAIVQQAECIVVGAYDQSGYVYWTLKPVLPIIG